MLAALLLAAAAPAMTAIDAERAFDRDAAIEGQWTAFRHYAAAGAIMFVPKPSEAQAFLKDRRDPPKSVRWQPIESFVSCDGGLAVNTGAWQRADGSIGYFTTVWRRQADGTWKWLLDHGDARTTPRAVPPQPRVHVASCTGKPDFEGVFIDGVSGGGASDDETINWRWHVESSGARELVVGLWNGAGFDTAIDDKVAA